MEEDLLALLFISHHLELVHLLQLGDLEGSMGLAGLHLKIMDLHVSLPDQVLLVKLLSEGDAGSLVELLAESGEVVLVHGGDIGKGSNLGQDCFRHSHDDDDEFRVDL